MVQGFKIASSGAAFHFSCHALDHALEGMTTERSTTESYLEALFHLHRGVESYLQPPTAHVIGMPHVQGATCFLDAAGHQLR